MNVVYPPAYIRSRNGISKRPLLLFVLGLLSFTQIKLIGHLAIVEIIFAVLTPYYLVTRWHAIRRSRLWILLLFIMGWFASAVVTDIVRETELKLMLKGVATPLLWASAFISM